MKFIKNPIFIIAISALVGLSIGAYALMSSSNSNLLGGVNSEPSDAVAVQKMTLTEEVRTTGKAKATKDISLAFERGGKVAEVDAQVGQQVQTGEMLAVLENADSVAQLRQAQAGVSSVQAQIQQYEAAVKTQQAKLDELRAGTRPEEIQSTETAVNNAENSWEGAKASLKTTQNKAAADLGGAYAGALNILPQALTSAKNALYALTDVQFAHFNGSDQNTYGLANAKADAVSALLGGIDGGRWTVNSLASLSGGAFAKVSEAQANPTEEKTDAAIETTLDALAKIKTALEAVPLDSGVTTTERNGLEAEKADINNQIMAVNGKKQTIQIQKATNDNAVATAESNEITAKNALAAARDALSLKQAGYAPDQIRGQEDQVDQSKANLASQKAILDQTYANVQNYQAQLEKTRVRAPINGIITQRNIEVGEIVSSNTPAFSIISAGQFEIEAYVSEADVAKVKEGDVAKVTLDAYGDEIFDAMVIAVDPAETVSNGVSTYKITLQFDKEDERIKPGMTANVSIETAKRENALAVPERAVITKNSNNFVLVEKANASPEERQVQTGIRGLNGYMEILSGLQEGDRVIDFGTINE